MNIEPILTEYTEKIIPRMIHKHYHLTLVKGGPDYPHLPEQSHFTHIITGVFGLVRLVQYLVQEGVRQSDLNETTLRQALAMYTIHDFHKEIGLEKLDHTEFAIPLPELRREYEELGLDQFARLDDHLLRAANTHKRSTRHGDKLLSNIESSFLWLLVRLADTIASTTGPAAACRSLRNYLADLGQAFLPKSPPGKYMLHYHQIKDVRGVLTNTIHQAVAQQLADRYGCWPLLFFAGGTVYIGPHLPEIDREAVISGVVDGVLQALVRVSEEDDEAIQEGMRLKNYDFEQYVYAFAGIERLLEAVHARTVVAKPDAKKALKEIDGLFAKRQEFSAEWRDTVEERFGLNLDENQTFNEYWSLAYRYLLFVDSLLRDLNPDQDRLEWLLTAFDLPQTAADNLREEGEIWARGGSSKYALVIAYHFLRGTSFAERSAEALPADRVLERLHAYTLQAMRQVDTRTGREAALKELGFRQELRAYLEENLHLSPAPATELTGDALAAYTRVKRKGHLSQLCSLCNRQSAYGQQLRTGILDDFGRIFSNRVLPALKAPGHNRMWCPICHLEFIFRKLIGMGLPPGAHYKNSRRIYFYILPTFSFTPEQLNNFKPILRPFQRVTAFNVRDYGKEWGVPHYWLEQRAFDPDWMENLQTVLERTADRLAELGGRNYVGERISIGEGTGQPHYLLLTWEKAARETESDDARVATRTEAWAKAIFAATILSGLTGCKLYVTERPYLPVLDPAELAATVTLDSPPPAMRGLIGGGRTDTISLYGREQGRRSGLETTLDVSAALWIVTTHLRPSKDKQIAARLERFNIDPLSGAYFYKEYGRENEGQSPHSPLDVACEVLLNIQKEREILAGKDALMDLVEKIAQKSLEIALPFGGIGRGKARRYELLFREAVNALRKAQRITPEMRQAALTAHRPSPESITEMKRLAAGTVLKGLERRRETKRGEILVRPWGADLARLVGEFIDLLVDELYLERAGGSFARFVRLENSLADGIYYYTDRNLSRFWEEHKQQKATQTTEE